MPELPEVETSRRGISPHIEGQVLTELIVRQPKLRWPIPDELADRIENQPLIKVERRGKYLLLTFPTGTALLHLGMSGSLRILSEDILAGKHDHVDMIFDNGSILRLNDPRRFGALLWAGDQPYDHSLLCHLGPEPMNNDFNVDYVFQRSRGKKLAIKQFIMDGKLVVGVGNIYANESLFLAGIHPSRPAGRISKKRYQELVAAIKVVIGRAIEQGGTSLRDFTQADGKPGYFKQALAVYGRAGENCLHCGAELKETRHNNRTTVYCIRCQT